MRRVKFSKDAIAAAVAVLLILIIIMAFYLNSLPKPLFPNEVTNYQGQDLSKINDFIETSIHGPQYVNASTYRLQITGSVNKTIGLTYDQVVSSFQK